jgi:hypothetical protein
MAVYNVCSNSTALSLLNDGGLCKKNNLLMWLPSAYSSLHIAGTNSYCLFS